MMNGSDEIKLKSIVLRSIDEDEDVCMYVDICVLAFRAEVSFLVRRTFYDHSDSDQRVGYDSSEADMFYGVSTEYTRCKKNSYNLNLGSMKQRI